jgi:mono/diheme cytochrome c family protein
MLAAASVTGGTPVSGRGTGQGVYTAAQAEEGARIYAVRCAMCHGVRLEGTVETPALVGRFIGNWAGRPLGDLFDYVSRAMPQPAPGSLSPEDNARVVAYILQVNGAAQGSRALPADARALRRIDFDAVTPR